MHKIKLDDRAVVITPVVKDLVTGRKDSGVTKQSGELVISIPDNKCDSNTDKSKFQYSEPDIILSFPTMNSIDNLSDKLDELKDMLYPDRPTTNRDCTPTGSQKGLPYVVTRNECLNRAIDITCKGREQYDGQENSFEKVADLWSAYTGYKFTASDAAMLLALLKVARMKTGRFKDDNYIDLAGYAACACELSSKESQND